MPIKSISTQNDNTRRFVVRFADGRKFGIQWISPFLSKSEHSEAILEQPASIKIRFVLKWLGKPHVKERPTAKTHYRHCLVADPLRLTKSTLINMINWWPFSCTPYLHALQKTSSVRIYAIRPCPVFTHTLTSTRGTFRLEVVVVPQIRLVYFHPQKWAFSQETWLEWGWGCWFVFLHGCLVIKFCFK